MDKVKKYWDAGRPQGGKLEDDAVLEVFRTLRIRHHYNTANWDDEESGWMIGCLKAVRTYDETKGATLHSYAFGLAIREAVDAVLPLSPKPQPPEPVETSSDLELFLFMLPSQELRDLARLLSEGYTIRGCAKKMGVSPTRAFRLLESLRPLGRKFYENSECSHSLIGRL